MNIIQEIPLQAIIKQKITININNVLIDIILRPLTVNNKELQNNTPEFQEEDIILNTDPITIIPKSTIFMVADIIVDEMPVAYNVLCNNSTYLNCFNTTFGYLFFYMDKWQAGDDKIDYRNFTDGNTHLYYSNYDALYGDFLSFVENNKKDLILRCTYGY